MRESRARTNSQMESMQGDAMGRLAAAQDRVRRVEMHASRRLQEEESRRIALEQEYASLKALVQPQTETMEDLAAELRRALERERVVQRELSMVRVRERGLDSMLIGM